MNPAAWRDFAHQPVGILLTLLTLLILLLAIGGPCCPMSAHAASSPAPVAGHDGCPEAPLPLDSPSRSFSWCCNGGACLHSVSLHDAIVLAPAANGWDEALPLFAIVEWSPLDWANGVVLRSSLTVSITGPPPLQRSRILRL